MRSFLQNFTSFYWWLSVVLVGILVNLFSAYLKAKLDVRLSKTSSWWRTRSEAKKKKWLSEVAMLRANHHEQIMTLGDTFREFFFTIFFMILGLALFSMAMFFENELAPIVGFILTLISVVSLIVATQSYYAGNVLLAKIAEARKPIRPSQAENEQQTGSGT